MVTFERCRRLKRVIRCSRIFLRRASGNADSGLKFDASSYNSRMKEEASVCIGQLFREFDSDGTSFHFEAAP